MLKFLGFLFSTLTLGAVAAAIGGAGVVWWYGRDLVDPERLADYHPPTMSRVYAVTGENIAEFAHERRLYSPIDEIPDLVKNAFISAEDKNFYTHPGVDALGIVKAAIHNIGNIHQNKRLHGASTITQQVMKNFLLSGDRSFERKIKEAILAVRIEGTMSKARILELYLNQIYLGARSYGVAAASLNYFGKPLEQLAPEEAAYLAALPKAPSSLNPVRNHAAAVARRNYVLEEMAQNGLLARAEADAAKARPLVTLLDKPAAKRGKRIPPMNYFAEEVRRELIGRLGEEEVYGGGLAIRSTLDPKLQRIGESALRAELESYDRKRGYRGPAARIETLSPENWRAQLAKIKMPRDVEGWSPAVVLAVDAKAAQVGIEGVDDPGSIPFTDVKGWARRIGKGGHSGKPKSAKDVFVVGDVILASPVMAGDGETVAHWSLRQIPELQGAFMAMDPHTGRVLAMQGGFSYQSSVFNRATQAARQPGSAFKPFVYAAALENGYTPATIILDAPVVVDQGNGKVWKPKNYAGKFYGPVPMRLGLELSRNLMTVRIAQDVGMETVAGYAERFGVYDHMPAHLAYALGAGETTLYKLVTAYGMFVNGGKLLQPTLIDRIQDRNGDTIYRHDQRACPDCLAAKWSGQTEPHVAGDGVEVLDPITAYQIVSMLHGVTTRGTAAKMSALGFPVAGKTGTTNDGKDAWFIGFTPDMVAGCFIGFDNPRSMGRHATGGGLCGPVFQKFMAAALKDAPHNDFRKPPGVEFAMIDRITGRRLPDGTMGHGVISEVFRAGTMPKVGATVGPVIDGGFSGDMLPVDLPQSEDDSEGGAHPRSPVNVGLGSGGLY